MNNELFKKHFAHLVLYSINEGKKSSEDEDDIETRIRNLERDSLENLRKDRNDQADGDVANDDTNSDTPEEGTAPEDDGSVAPNTDEVADAEGELPPEEAGVQGDGGEEAAVDPETGQPVDPATGEPIDPETGEPVVGETEISIGRIYELKRIYARLLTTSKLLDHHSNDKFDDIKKATLEAIDLFHVISINLDQFQDKIDDIIVDFYKFIQKTTTQIETLI